MYGYNVCSAEDATTQYGIVLKCYKIIMSWRVELMLLQNQMRIVAITMRLVTIAIDLDLRKFANTDH